MTADPTLDPSQATDFVAALARSARAAQREVAGATREVKDAALAAMALALLEQEPAILAANAVDLERARQEGMKEGLVDRLALSSERLSGIASALHEVASLPDPVGQVIDGQTLPNGLRVRRLRVPLGVVGVIYEARPNVTVDVAALALKSGNAVLLRGGHAAEHTNAAIVATLRGALESAGLPPELVATVDPAGRAGASALMQARGLVDVLVPRGGAGLIKAVVESSSVPVIETGSGNCHVYVDASAVLEDAVAIIVNAKTQRVGVCNAAETLLVHRQVAATYLPQAARALWQRGVVLHADDATREILEQEAVAAGASQLLVAASQEDWETEYGSLDLAVRVVDDVDAATEHIRRYSTGHTEAVLSQDLAVVRRFTAGVDSAVVMVNASTRFTDGGQLGLGAELGISTQKLHARGPMGLAALTTTQWLVEGEGHVRP
ncbi:glutamate-5-semialdehyde dehydrogenase [Actinomyces urogenitalis DSM 15434]|uniref:Gamma-glutamyl phosphate reductase n=3 Tax=Actinomyces urogenitalis TaxID=103621 RepID=C0W2U2_9ACTO|nr:glutamate-5-semialdehyde dehydrogenase [Actinomyces urogenitalis]EEH66943.1 glutamate-5-semialdehyde dehydrogenase [Actinomyces urogenitalis DSM 15434]KGF04675.1 gamma-glutamyl phosphate reductase [Actinomyces urogenitalis S6-C4]KGF04695.1 gamma-glutamyl phosphate reductase [Actinomyces urogenitalis S6-C4]MBS6072638.1 glutamate-5-semialdehyde dehydrogenase [Actinomyces urogenitalis]MDK8835812.1 glutamate-5-semialdehyde dehydrogenase [Actinomyces urogenitalis]